MAGDNSRNFGGIDGRAPRYGRGKRRNTEIAFPTPAEKKKKVNGGYHCCVPLCNGDTRTGPKLGFHCFPKNERIRRIWIQKIRRDIGKNFKITQCTRVCGRHFAKYSYYTTAKGRQWLVHGAIPTIFPWSKNDGQHSARTSQRASSDECQLSSCVEPPTPSLFQEAEETLGKVVAMEHNYASPPASMEEKYAASLEEKKN